jgi:malonyl-CoA/methylmalonyl-CoA synthetase
MNNSSPLLSAVREGSDRLALTAGSTTISYGELHDLAAGVADSVGGLERVMVWAAPTLETSVAVIGALLAGVTVIPVNPKSGPRELDHIIDDARPGAVLAPEGYALPDSLMSLRRIAVRMSSKRGELPSPPASTASAFVMYTSGTTGPPKGVLLSHRAVASNLDALAAAWDWTSNDVLTHALPLFHVHGLIVGVVGPLHLGGGLIHFDRFSAAQLAGALESSATMMFGVPTMYHRLALAATEDAAVAQRVRRARLLVSGSAALPPGDFAAIESLTGHRVAERYGMTETLIICATRAEGERSPGYVGEPLPGVEIQLLDEDGEPQNGDPQEPGEIIVKSPSLLTEYLNRPDANADALRNGWFHTGDLAQQDSDGRVRIVGRSSIDIIKSGGHKIGAGEIEGALLDHPGVSEAAVTAEPDDDLGERIVAWIVSSDDKPTPRELIDHVATQLTPHKRPRVVHFVDALPRNEMGKVLKRELMGSRGSRGSLDPPKSPGSAGERAQNDE